MRKSCRRPKTVVRNRLPEARDDKKTSVMSFEGSAESIFFNFKGAADIRMSPLIRRNSSFR